MQDLRLKNIYRHTVTTGRGTNYQGNAQCCMG
jgi:hypothetical protein